MRKPVETLIVAIWNQLDATNDYAFMMHCVGPSQMDEKQAESF